MNMHTMFGSGLYDAHNRRIAVVRGEDIYDGDNRRVATIRGKYLFDSDNRKMMTLRGSNIYDAGNKLVGSILDVQKSIKDGGTGMLAVALWYCFVR